MRQLVMAVFLCHAHAQRDHEREQEHVRAQPQFSAANVLRFVHIGKCGGTSVGDWLRNLDEHRQLTRVSSGYEKFHMNRSYFDNEDSNFVVWVRDPIDRFESAFDWQVSVVHAPAVRTCTLGGGDLSCTDEASP